MLGKGGISVIQTSFVTTLLPFWATYQTIRVVYHFVPSNRSIAQLAMNILN